MKPSKFAYVNAKTLDEALLSLKQPESKIIEDLTIIPSVGEF